MEKKILLTIDDGPSDRADQLINYLHDRQIGAILFCCGNLLEARSYWTVRAIQLGYIIGNHSYSHPDFNRLAKEVVEEQVAKTDSLIETAYAQAGRKRPAKYFRFPYGRIRGSGGTDAAKEDNQAILAGLGYWWVLVAH